MTHAVDFDGKAQPPGRTGVWCLVDLPLDDGQMVRNQVIVDMLHQLRENELVDWGFESHLAVRPLQRTEEIDEARTDDQQNRQPVQQQQGYPQ